MSEYERLQRLLDQTRNDINAADNMSNLDMKSLYTQAAIQRLYEIVRALVEQQAPDWAERAEAEYLDGMTA